MRYGQKMKAFSLSLVLAVSVIFFAGCESGGLNNAGIFPANKTTVTTQRVDNTQPSVSGEDQTSSETYAAADTSRSVKVAVLLPLSGAHAELGQGMLDAAQLSLFNVAGGNFELVPQDTKGTPEGARAAAQKVLADGVDLILGPLFSGSVRAVKPLATNANVNVIAFSTDWTLAGGNTFMMGFTPFDQVERVTQYAATKGIRSIGLVAVDDEYGQHVSSVFRKAASVNSVNVPSSVAIAQNNMFPTPELSGFAQNAGSAQAVFMTAGGKRALDISNILATSGLRPENMRRLGTGLFEDTALYGAPGMNGAWFAASAPASRADFEKEFTGLYGYKPPRLATLAYDATALSAVLAQRGQNLSGKEAFGRSKILNPNGFAGVDGIFRFKSDGLAQRGLAVLEISNGKAKVIDPAPQRFR